MVVGLEIVLIVIVIATVITEVEVRRCTCRAVVTSVCFADPTHVPSCPYDTQLP